MIKKIVRYSLPGILAVTLAYLLFPHREKVKGHPRDYAEIAAEGVLRAATEYNSQSFYVDGDTLAGFHYELIAAFARDHDLRLEITPVMSFEQRLRGLEEGRFDVIAYGIPTTSEQKDSLLFTMPLQLSRQVLIQRRPTSDEDSLFIRSQLDLAGRTLHVVKGSPVIQRIHHLGTEIADTIYVAEVERYGVEQLMALVAHGDIDYAVCNESLARAVADSFPGLDVHTAISFTQFYSWGVSKHSPALLDSLNLFLARNLRR